jgi:hypothetical protein
MYGLLKENGMVLVNIISAIDGEEGMFLRAEYATYQSVFPQVWLFPISAPGNGMSAQNIMLVALKSDRKPSFSSRDTELNEYLGHVWTGKVGSDMPVLTDDHAPVDRYITRMMLGR